MVIKDLLKDTTAMVCGRIDSKENNVEKMLNMMPFSVRHSKSLASPVWKT